MKPATKTRIYLVTENTNSDGTNIFRLVRAKSQAQALNHVVMPRFSVEAATPDQIASLMTDGLRVEDTTAPDDVAQTQMEV